MERYDFYIGYEGEPQITIIHSDIGGNIHSLLTMWIGYFDSIMKQIKPNNQGNWEGIVLIYHLHTGWFEESKWSPTTYDLELFLTQLEMVDISQFDSKEQSVFDVLVTVLKNSIRMNGTIKFDYS